MRSSDRLAELDLSVTRRAAPADGVVVLDLRHPAGASLPPWAPGAHIDLDLGPGLTRQYSLCGDTADRSSWRIAVLLEPTGRGGSQRVHDKLTEGSLVRVRGPRNHFVLEAADRYLFIAGGIGITPILPMMAAAEATRVPWTLVYGGRSRPSMAFGHEILCRYGEGVTLWPQDEKGLLDLDMLLGEPQPRTLVYCCGPEPLLAAAEARCAAWPEGALHVERFAPRPVGEQRGRAAEAAEQAFEVELAQTGLTLRVPPGESILQVIEAAGVQVLSSCTEGTCGTCETAVLGGLPEHRDSLLTPAERASADTMMICVSRSVTPRLVLDL
jgi:ferredoxin-NADP reductase